VKFNTPKSQSTLASIANYLRANPGADDVAIAWQFGLSARQAQRYLRAARQPKIEIPVFLKLKDWPATK
jgi:hypothetical protein